MPPRSPKKLGKRKKVVLSLSQKVDICNQLERGVNRNYLMKLHNIGSSTITGIMAQKEEFWKFLSNDEKNRHDGQRSTLRKGKLEKLEDVLFEWYTAKRSENCRVSGSMIIDRAKYLYVKMKIKEPCVFSNGWLSRFKLRHGMRRFAEDRVDCEKETVLNGASQMYCEYFITLVVEHDLSTEQIYSACESKLLWRSLNVADVVYESKCASDDSMRNVEQLITLVCANASGKHKLKVFAVGESERNSSTVDPDASIEYISRSDVLMDKELYIQWFEMIFVPSVKLNLRNTGKSEDSNVLLLLDNCAQELLDCELVCGNIFTVFLPTDVTSVILPMNQGVIDDFKCNYRIDVMKKLCRNEMSSQYFLTEYNIGDALFYLAGAWDSVNASVLKKAWNYLLPN